MTDVIAHSDQAPRTRPATEQEAREVAEAAREKEWHAPSFVRELFEGSFRLDLVHPVSPAADPAEIERAGRSWSGSSASCASASTATRSTARARSRARSIQGLRELGAFGIKIPQEYGGLGLTQTSYTRAIGW